MDHLNVAAEKESLVNTLKRYDSYLNVEEVLGPANEEKSSSDTNTLMLQILLEITCRKTETDPRIRHILFLRMWKKLTKAKLINNVIFDGDELANVRNIVASEFEKEILIERKKISSYPVPAILSSLDEKERAQSFADSEKYSREFEPLSKIGEGGFGTVWKVEHKVDGIIYAVKKIMFKYKKDSDYLKVIREVKSFATLHHLNVVGYNQAWFEYSTASSKSASCETSSTTSSPSDGSLKSRKRTLKKKQSSSINSFSKMELKGEISDVKSSVDDFISFREDLNLLNINSSINKCSKVSALFSASSSQSSHSDSSESNEERDIDQSNSQKTFLFDRVLLYIQMEYCNNDLRQWLDERAKGQPLPFQLTVLEIFRDILNGVAHIHSKSIIHRDLKPQNIFFSATDNTMKIGDFGLATLSDSSLETNLELSTYHSSDCGTLPYAAPEQRKNSKYNSKVDIYSLGVIFVELLLNPGTRMEFNEALTSILNGKVPEKIRSYGPAYVNLVKNLTSINPNLRHPAHKVMSMPPVSFISKINQNANFEIKQLKEIIAEQANTIQEMQQQMKELEDRMKKCKCYDCKKMKCD